MPWRTTATPSATTYASSGADLRVLPARAPGRVVRDEVRDLAREHEVSAVPSVAVGTSTSPVGSHRRAPSGSSTAAVPVPSGAAQPRSTAQERAVGSCATTSAGLSGSSTRVPRA